ncbi:hypothetical protein [Glutamicibacter soli]|uniref:hypothetical protein n=1 Tax=Glutamicibacter soli TaxID=453836 RepID=UPI003FD58235
MSILEILEAHTVKRPWSEASRMRCKCGETVTAETEGQLYALHRAHVVQVLEQHEREAKAGAVEGTAKYLRKRFKRVDNPEHIFGANLAIMLIAEHAEEIRNPS